MSSARAPGLENKRSSGPSGFFRVGKKREGDTERRQVREEKRGSNREREREGERGPVLLNGESVTLTQPGV